MHLDVEKPGVLDRYGLATAWATLFDASKSAAPFIEALEEFKRPVAMDWGFPPEHLDAVRKLFDGGVMLWWFAADWAVARHASSQRVATLHRRLRRSNPQHRSRPAQINALFRSHVEYTLPSTGIYTPPDKIWESMIDTLAGPPSKHRFHARRQ